jgi:hypothetical protein
VPISLDLLLAVARKHTPSTEGWFEGVRTHAGEQATSDGFFNEVRKFLAAPTSSKKER